MRPNGKQVAVLLVTLLVFGMFIPPVFMKEPVVGSGGPEPFHFQARLESLAMSLGVLLLGVVATYLLRTKRPGARRTWSRRRIGIIVGAVAVLVAGAAGLDYEIPPCGHVVVDWYGLLPEHDCPYLSAAELVKRIWGGQHDYRREHGQYAASLENLIAAGCVPRWLAEQALREGFVTKMSVTRAEGRVVSWEACSSSPDHEQAMHARRRCYPRRVDKTTLPRALLHP